MASRTNHVIVVGAGLSGLSCALYLSAAGYNVTVVDRRTAPGGRHTALEIDGVRFDAGPAGLPTVEAITAPLRAVGEHLRDWIDVLPLDPICRAHYPDGTTLDVSPDPHRTTAAIRALCGGAEARAYTRFRKVIPYGIPAGLMFNDPRTQRLFGSMSLFGFNPLDSAWYPRGGMSAVCRALGSVAEKRGVTMRFDTNVVRWEAAGGGTRVVRAVHTADGERLTADAFVIPPVWHPATRGPSQLAIHLAVSAGYSKIAQHNLHFGEAWQTSRQQVLTRGELMTDPTILVSAPSLTDPTAGRHTYRITVPAPNLKLAPLLWDGPAARIYAGEILATLEARGYLDLGIGPAVSYVVTPADWARQDMAYGIPHPRTSRPSRLHPTLANVVITGLGPSAARTAAEKVVRA